MPSDLKAFLRIRKQLKLQQGILYRNLQVSNNSREWPQLVLPIEYRPKSMAGCHDQIGHLTQDRVLELLRHRFYWPGMHMYVAFYINSCLRCISRKSQSDVAPLLNILNICQVQLANMVNKIQTPKGQDPTGQRGQDNTWILDQ